MEEADSTTGDDVTRRPGMAEAESGEKNSPQAAEESARSSIVADAIGNIYSVAEGVSVCFYCGSHEHDIHDCQDPEKPKIEKVLKEMRQRLVTEDPPEAPQAEAGAQPMDQDDDPKEDTPAFNTSAEYQWYTSSIEMSVLGDRDEGGRFCVSRRKVDDSGPESLIKLQDVVRDAVMRGHGDQWSVEDFMNLYPAKNLNKWMYERLTAPTDGFLKVIPFTGCQFANFEFYNGVEYGHNVRISLDASKDQVSTELNKCLRHHTGVNMYNPELGLKCDDMGWVKIETILKYERIWRHERARKPHVFVIKRGYTRQPDTWNKDEAEFRMRTLMKITFYYARWGRRVREQILAFGIPNDIDRTKQVCVDNGIDVNTEIPEEGLLLYPVAVRAPAGHSHRHNDEVILISMH